MEILIKEITHPQVMRENVLYFVKRNDGDDIRIAQRVAFTVSGITDAVIYINESGMSYDSYDSIREKYTIIGPVNKIEVS
jgi:hypothetical protein